MSVYLSREYSSLCPAGQGGQINIDGHAAETRSPVCRGLRRSKAPTVQNFGIQIKIYACVICFSETAGTPALPRAPSASRKLRYLSPAPGLGTRFDSSSPTLLRDRASARVKKR